MSSSPGASTIAPANGGFGADFEEAVRAGLSGYADFNGRAGRRQFWLWVLFTFVAGIATSIIDGLLGGGPFSLLLGLAVVVPSLAYGARRLHDTGKSGWFLLAGLIPLLGALYLIYLYLQPGDLGSNEWGPPYSGDLVSGDFAMPAHPSAAGSAAPLSGGGVATEPATAPPHASNFGTPQLPVQPNRQTTPNFDEDRRRAAALRDYRTPAIITLVLYLVFWLPGLIANLVYLSSASNDAKMSGYAPEGKGCLTAMLWVFVIVPLALSAITVLIVVSVLGGMR